ncbi:hypothetical protein COT44_01735 [Candidatus Shapirobacteria bacterium CG08_land_8_20_14_0_20_39_18]|uniref:Uncharacterized protein n=1 Tax=Candidatus Shapirobacteria bacterium CG08_land_8_20_14_0_20_39_18 TaxID=1974883 RepID=A0A2M6XDF8_9BACT|nr:MAG: hypothetical protein COT44_01735 [Candidatus Shapirobacteria bacterium CG08_land_8_20_14_0_20_39_18]PIY65849.1 MAG: hypothetical protein COY91_01765 [Candidatus Shapirobacteria bacterium CG_4_10_14_0_8_um_filter_39_15]PJE68457.1 MAG: hypothetical protein COU94_01715 [Candidatus Shapirobacteria bacterium CG10_big_fil_rev_8_21_14_0_10_38_8]
MKKTLIIIFSLYLLSLTNAFAFCPVCTVAVGAGVGLSRWLGINDTITGLWIGGLTVSISAWTLNWLATKNKTFPYQKIKEKNDGHSHFPFEKVVLPVAPLIVLSFIFGFITK